MRLEMETNIEETKTKEENERSERNERNEEMKEMKDINPQPSEKV
jgi:hypothetical protein